ncbi:BamA/TamA family outer membrane protein [Mucilaginibacter litoreus]|uniref:BamA/TamA family outer membrane protein n=1 Tax=Mucilaginibacter litoreus TaxID=1048221 RepID=A0ABW3AU28_9SPHI
MYKKFIAVFFCFAYFNLSAQNVATVVPASDTTLKDTSRQTDLIDIVHDIFPHKSQKKRFTGDKTVYFSVLPFSASVPGGVGRALITSTTAGVYLGPRQTTNISSATFAPYFNFKGRFGLPLRTSIWLPDNEWTIQGDTRFLVYPQYTWGLGSANSYAERTMVDYKYIRFYQAVLKRIKPYLFAGFGYNLDYRINVRSEEANVDLRDFTGYQYGVNGNSFSSGISLNLLYDTRNNSINPLPGSYINVIYRNNPKFLGSQESWRSIYIDVRKYISLNPANPNQQNTLAFWSYLWKSLSEKTPYLDLPSTGWDPGNRSARGIDQNRYRGRTLLYFEAEYRRDITNNGLLGFVLFSNVNTLSGSGTIFRSWHPAAGTGLRIKFNKGSNTNIGVDYGFSQGYRAIMVNLGEAF